MQKNYSLVLCCVVLCCVVLCCVVLALLGLVEWQFIGGLTLALPAQHIYSQKE